MPPREPSELEAFEAAAKAAKTSSYVLHLVISGRGHHSNTALLNVRRFCEERLQGRYELKLTSLDSHPEKAKSLEIFATPTLIREFPLPQRRFIGNMTHLAEVLIATDQARSAAGQNRENSA
jgi:circadian clock protein KaiB